ncbi:hypothetical protein FPV67DRAFT_1778262 [Lyophyllum atratum]|nr:hypothetical protein FPV67DRAFT_1778262 [Lyophyllum atratum]
MVRRRATSPGPSWSVLEGMSPPSSSPSLNMQDASEAARKRKSSAANVSAKKPQKKKTKSDEGTRATSSNTADTSTLPPARSLARAKPGSEVIPQRKSARRRVPRNASPGPSSQLSSTVFNNKKRPHVLDSEDDKTPPPTLGLAKWLAANTEKKKKDAVPAQNGSAKTATTTKTRTRSPVKKTQSAAVEVIELFSNSDGEERPTKRRRNTMRITPRKDKASSVVDVIDLCSDDDTPVPPPQPKPLSSRRSIVRAPSAPKPVSKAVSSSSGEPRKSRRSIQKAKFADDTNDKSSAADDLPTVQVHVPYSQKAPIEPQFTQTTSPTASEQDSDSQVAAFLVSGFEFVDSPPALLVPLLGASFEAIDDEEDMYAAFIEKDDIHGESSTATISEHSALEASPKAQHVQDSPMDANITEISQLPRTTSMELSLSLKGPIPTSDTPTALSHVIKRRLPVPTVIPLDPPAFIPGDLTRRLFAQSFLPPKPQVTNIAAAVLDGSQLTKAPQVVDTPLLSPRQHKDDVDMEADVKTSTQDVSKPAAEKRPNSSQDPSPRPTKQPVEETGDIVGRVLTTEVLEKNHHLGQALSTSRLIMDIVREAQQPKPQPPTSVNDPADVVASSQSRPRTPILEPDAARPPPLPQSPMATQAPHDEEHLPLTLLDPEPFLAPRSRTQTPVPDDVEASPRTQLDLEPSPTPRSERETAVLDDVEASPRTRSDPEPSPAPDDVEASPQTQLDLERSAAPRLQRETAILDNVETSPQTRSNLEPFAQPEPQKAFIPESTSQPQPDEHQLPTCGSSSSQSSLATQDDSPLPSTPTTSPYDHSHFYIRSMSLDDDDDLGPEVYNKILDMPTLPAPETDDDDDLLLSHCFEYPDLDVAC